MRTPAPALRPARRRPSTARRALVAAAVAAAGVAVFLFGLAFGRATAEQPPEGTQTLVRTLSVLTVEPARDTVTVTVSD